MDKFLEARLNMVKNQVATNNVSNHRVLEAMSDIPREMFVAKEYRDVAYLDAAIPMTTKKTMMRPDILAKLIQLADINNHDKVLNISCGSGYSTAILCTMSSNVVGIDDDHILVAEAAMNLERLGFENFALKVAPILLGAPDLSPFQVIILNIPVTPDLLPNLLHQLVKGGRLVCIEEDEGLLKGVKYQNTGNGSIGRTEHFDVHNFTKSNLGR
jgi:protein-L-isoaspartate(D-aspartate) O-methyltransferase